ncbi:hypothetical protein [Coleofasciculus sp. H7-2]
MTYYAKLHPWCIIRSLPDMRSRVAPTCRASASLRFRLTEVVG